MMVQTHIYIFMSGCIHDFRGHDYKSLLHSTGISRGNKDQCMFLIYLEAISVSNNKGIEVCVI